MDLQGRGQDQGIDNYYNKEENNENINRMDNTVDWRGRSSHPEIHGGMRAASFVLGTYICLIYIIQVNSKQ